MSLTIRFVKLIIDTAIGNPHPKRSFQLGIFLSLLGYTRDNRCIIQERKIVETKINLLNQSTRE
jgi:hypothetical protein